MYTLITPDEIERFPLGAMQAAIETLSMCELLFAGGELEAGKSQIIGIHNTISALVGTFETVRDELEKREREEVAMEADGKDAYRRGYKAGRADLENVMTDVVVRTSARFHYDRGYEAGLAAGQADAPGDTAPTEGETIPMHGDDAADVAPSEPMPQSGQRPMGMMAPPLTEPVPDGERADDGRERRTA